MSSLRIRRSYLCRHYRHRHRNGVLRAAKLLLMIRLLHVRPWVLAPTLQVSQQRLQQTGPQPLRTPLKLMLCNYGTLKTTPHSSQVSPTC